MLRIYIGFQAIKFYCFPPPRPLPPHFNCFPSTTATTFLFFSLHPHHHHHRHISIVFFSTTTTTTFLWFSFYHHHHHHHISINSPPPRITETRPLKNVAREKWGSLVRIVLMVKQLKLIRNQSILHLKTHLHENHSIRLNKNVCSVYKFYYQKPYCSCFQKTD